MSEPRVFVAECALCHTKFTEPTTECPVCGGTSLRKIREAVPAPKTIPKPALRKTPSPKAKPTPPREPDYLHVPPRRLARPAAPPRPAPPPGPPARSDEIKARLTAAMAECREAKRACAAALKRKNMAEASLHKLHAEFRRALEAERAAARATSGRKESGLLSFLKAFV